MSVRLEPQTWLRLPALTTPPRRAPRVGSALRWLAPYWLLALAIAWVIHADILPVRPALLAVAPPPGAERGPSRGVLWRDRQQVAPTVLAAGRARGLRFGTGAARIEDLVAQPAFPEPEPPELAYNEPAPDDEQLEPGGRDPIAGARRGSASNPRVRYRTARTATRRSASKRPAARSRSDRRRQRAEVSEPPPREPPARERRAAPVGKPLSKPAKRSYASTGGGQSCEAVVAAYREQVTMGGDDVPPDLTAGQYGAVLNRGSYLMHCGVPPSMRIQICAAVQNGRALGVTVRTTPAHGRINRCVAGAVRSLAFPSHPRLDVTTTTFEPD